MAYGKFAPKISNRDLQRYGYGGVYGNTYGNTWSDIGYALGAALGNLWGTNYNQRGIEKGEAEGRQALQDAYNKVYGTAQPAPESLQTQYQDVSAKMGIPQGSQTTPQSNDKNTYIDSTKKYLGGKDTGKTMKDQTPQRDIKAEKYDTFMSKYNSGTPNPDGDAQKVDALTQAANGNLANMDFSKLPSMSAADLQSAIRAELRANGRTDYQINKVLENLSPTIKAKVQEGNNINFGNLYNTLNQQIKNGELDAANMTFAKMSELNPKMAAALQPKMKRAWDATALEQNFQTKFNFYKQDPNISEQEAYNLARYGSVYNPAQQAKFMGVSGRGNRGTASDSTGGSTSSSKKNTSTKQNDAQIKLYKEIIADYEEKQGKGLYSKEDYNDAKNGLKLATKQSLAGVHVVTDDDIKAELKQAKFNTNMSNADLINVVKGIKGMDSDRIRGIVQWIENEWPENEGVGFFRSLDRNGYTSPQQTKEAPSTPARYDTSQIGNQRIGQWLSEGYTNNIAIPWELAKQIAMKNKHG